VESIAVISDSEKSKFWVKVEIKDSIFYTPEIIPLAVES
jgi:hypothetical protein